VIALGAWNWHDVPTFLSFVATAEALAKANHLCFVIHTHFRLRNLKQRG
jgi:hypothetical protein